MNAFEMVIPNGFQKMLVRLRTPEWQKLINHSY